MNTIYYLVNLEAQHLYSQARLGAAQILVKVTPVAVQPLIEKSGESSEAIDDARFRATAERAVLDWAHNHFPIGSQGSYTWNIDAVSNPQLVTSRVAPTTESNCCRLWVLKTHEFANDDGGG